ncbi:MAG: twin-arginine translocase TatA/TatE family subunit [Nitrososphaera sp.]
MVLAALVREIAGSEWIILILLVLVLMFGTKRLPQMSRTLGRAAGEYEKARNMVKRELGQGFSSYGSPPAQTSGVVPRITGPVTTEREKLEQIAQSLGIDSKGKTDDELRTQISQKMSS